MRVLYYAYSLVVGGMETVTTEYLLELKKQGVEVCLVEDFYTDSFLTQKLRDGGIEIFTLWNGSAEGFLGMKRKKTARFLGLYRRFNRVLEKWKPDVVHLNGFPDHPDQLHFPAKRMLFTFHSRVERNLGMLGERNTALLKKMCAQGLTLLALTEADRSTARKLLETDRVLCIPNGVDLSGIRAERYDREQLEKVLGVPAEGFLVGTVGRMHPVKNQERLVEIFCRVKQLRPDALLLLVGADLDGRLQKLRALARSAGVEDRFFTPGMRPDANAIVAAMDCFVLPSLSESFGLAAVEAQAQNVRCVVSRAVPEDVLCSAQAVALSLEETDDRWAEAILNCRIENPHPGDLETFDTKNVVARLKTEYERLVHG